MKNDPSNTARCFSLTSLFTHLASTGAIPWPQSARRQKVRFRLRESFLKCKRCSSHSACKHKIHSNSSRTLSAQPGLRCQSRRVLDSAIWFSTSTPALFSCSVRPHQRSWTICSPFCWKFLKLRTKKIEITSNLPRQINCHLCGLAVAQLFLQVFVSTTHKLLVNHDEAFYVTLYLLLGF